MAYNSAALQFLKSLQDRMKESQAALQEALRLQNQAILDFNRTVEGFRPSTCYEDDLIFMEKMLKALKDAAPAREALEAARDNITTTLERSYLPSEEPAANSVEPKPVFNYKKRVVNFDEKAVEDALLIILDDGQQYRKAALIQFLIGRSIPFSKAGLDRILHTSPQIEMVGERDQTRYQLKEVVVAARS